MFTLILLSAVVALVVVILAVVMFVTPSSKAVVRIAETKRGTYAWNEHNTDVKAPQ